MDEATWAAFAATLTLLGLVWTALAWRRRGATAAARALGFTLLPIAAWLTGTLEMFTEIAGSITDWATSLVFNPITWAGIGVGGLGVALIVVAGIVRERQLARAKELGGPAPGRRLEEAPSTRERPGGPVLDDDLADIEEMLRKRGIT